MDDAVISKQSSPSKNPPSNDEEILKFPKLGEDKGHMIFDWDEYPDDIMPDLFMLDVAVPDLESYTSAKVT